MVTFDPSFRFHHNRAAVAMNQDYLFWGHEAGKGVQRGELRIGKKGYGTTGGGSYCRSSAVVHGDIVYLARTDCFSSLGIWDDRLLIGLDSGRLESYALEDGTVQKNI